MYHSSVLRFSTLLLIASFLIPQVTLAQVSKVPSRTLPAPVPTPVSVTAEGTALNSELQILRKSLEERATHLEYMKYKMLSNKLSQISPKNPNSVGYNYSSDYYIRPEDPSPLSREYTGVSFNTAFGASRDVVGSIDLITGGTAINESLQLGSIGSGEAEAMTWQQRNNMSRIRSSLELYYNANSYKYPDSLNDLLVRKDYYLTAQQLTDFTYKTINDGASYELRLSSLATGPVPITSVAGLTIKHHPWTEMIGDNNPVVPDIYKLVPDDYLFVHFTDMVRYQELAKTAGDMNGPLGQVYGIGDALTMQEKIFERLEIVNDPGIYSFVDEVAFVSYDFDGYPATDYALIFKTKSSPVDSFIGNYVKTSKDRSGLVGDYYVVATTADLFQHIKDTASGRVSSMASALDLKYSLSVLDEPRDGLAFISDAFVEKITSPAYRIKARRRNTVLGTLETLQYAAFAYRDITGHWPYSISTMMEEGYLKNDSVYELNKYAIDRSSGVVLHSEWGSIYKVKPLSQVQINTVTPAEKALYERFRDGYQSLWREFIDPVAVSILIGDEIKMHTIILPLIDSSEYNWIKDVVGSEQNILDFVVHPDRIPALQATSHIDVDNILYAMYRMEPSEFDVTYQRCREDYYKVPYEQRRGTSISQKCSTSEDKVTKEEAVLAVKERIADIIKWEGAHAELFSFMGDEVMAAASEEATFLIEDLSNFDVYLGIEFTDVVAGKEFIDHVFDFIFKEIFGGDVRSVGLFGIAPGKPIKNTYNDVEYYMIPTGWINIFYVFINNRMYLAVSQNTINTIIDGTKEGVEWPQHMQRLMDYLDPAKDVSLLIDAQKIKDWFDGYAKEELTSYGVSLNLESLKTYLKEVELFQARVAPNQQNTSDGFYSHVPDEWFGLPLQIKNQTAFVQTKDGPIDLDRVQSYGGYYYGSRSSAERPVDALEFEDFIKYVDVEALVENWFSLDTFGADLSITDEGLDIQVAFSNLYRSEYDERVSHEDLTKSNVDYQAIMAFALLIIALLVAFGLQIKKQREDDLKVKKGDKSTFPTMSFDEVSGDEGGDGGE